MDQTGWIILVEGLAVTVVGSLLHFAYQWSGKNKFIAIFAAVNESTWEHIKLALSGIFACTLVDVWIFGDHSAYWLAKGVSFLMPVIVIPILFYGYRAILKVKSFFVLDILIFMVASFASAWAFAELLKVPEISPVGSVLTVVINVVMIAMYLLLTRFPLHDFIFRDPITHRYGKAAFRPLKMGKKKTKKRIVNKTRSQNRK